MQIAQVMQLAHEALTSHKSIADLVVEGGLMDRERVEKLLAPARLSGLQPVTQAIPVISPDELP